jgi:hypothetical protein
MELRGKTLVQEGGISHAPKAATEVCGHVVFDYP